MTTEIAQALTKLFAKHRIIFWYDSKQELRSEYEALSLDDIEKIELDNNEFGVKYHILREKPKQKFLLYQEGSAPADLDNWLLDVKLAHGEFRTDRVGMWLAELELGLEFSAIVQNHLEFFKAQERKNSLKRLLKSTDTANDIELKMLAVCTGADARIDTILETLLAEIANNREEKYKLIARCQLDSFLWKQVKYHYGYNCDEPQVKDFAIVLFTSCYKMSMGEEVSLTPDAIVFLKRWKDSIKWQESFKTLSKQCAEDPRIEQDLAKREITDLIDIDYFRVIEKKIISDLVRGIVTETVSSFDVSSWIRQRKQSYWYKEFEDLYKAIDAAAQLIKELNEAYLTIDSLTEGIHKYCHSWFRLDQLYRKFVYHVLQSAESSVMESLSDLVENHYVNNYLLPLNDRWQSLVDATEQWSAAEVTLQRKFFSRWIEPFLKKNRKVFVIISDALRYEIGEEFLKLIRSEDRYEADLEAAMAMLPSYTQLGMAALLPNGSLSLTDKGNVEVDEQSSQGLVNRKKQLDRALPNRATAVKAEELMKLNQEDRRSLVRNHDLVYVYHNRIDATGDKRDSEERVFEAVEDTLKELIQLIKKLANANVSNILITADHGFIYQNRSLYESDFASVEPQGEEILFRDRRFILGRCLEENSSLRKFTSEELGLSGDLEVQIPKSINRLRRKGSGSRYVHGGASLQEIVIPVLKINKKRQSDTALVEVNIIPGASSIISSKQLVVMLYQTEAVTEKLHPRYLRAGIYAQNGELISDAHELSFDIPSQNSREREQLVMFILTKKADELNEQEVTLRLEQKISGTSQYKEYKSLKYTMRRSFTSDFDF
ncbi:MAG: BREX-1 system phosphatase PglZ type A [Xenococcus sp. (in: cyanobacteria)]